jgi:hypothetical protein
MKCEIDAIRNYRIDFIKDQSSKFKVQRSKLKAQRFNFMITDAREAGAIPALPTQLSERKATRKKSHCFEKKWEGARRFRSLIF